MKKMIANVRFTYRSRVLLIGEEFDADDEHVELFTLIGHAHVPEGSQTYRTRVMTSDAETRRSRKTRAKAA